jgi:tRNA nucleotidyltransferase (CCA-adding enzyme)
MDIYLVGGAVRDTLLGLPVTDRDWLVVGSTPQEMTALGYLPVGRDFPVFLHPTTHEEYALARTERKTAPGYHGFAFHAEPDVTLQDDLARRDLTINSIAIHASLAAANGLFDARALVDPHGGQQDLAARVLRHVSPAFRQDPVRILRLARLAARFSDFTVAEETTTLMQHMVLEGEADHLVAERVWQELSRGLMEKTPSRMLQVLQGCHAWARLLPEIRVDSALLKRLDTSAQLNTGLPVRFACLMNWGSDSNLSEDRLKLIGQLCERLRVPQDCRELAQVVARECLPIEQCMALKPTGLLDLLERCDALRKPSRFSDALLACECAARPHDLDDQSPWPQGAHLQAALALVLEQDTQAISAQALAEGKTGPAIGQLIRDARVAALAGLSSPHGVAPGSIQLR